MKRCLCKFFFKCFLFIYQVWFQTRDATCFSKKKDDDFDEKMDVSPLHEIVIMNHDDDDETSKFVEEKAIDRYEGRFWVMDSFGHPVILKNHNQPENAYDFCDLYDEDQYDYHAVATGADDSDDVFTSL